MFHFYQFFFGGRDYDNTNYPNKLKTTLSTKERGMVSENSYLADKGGGEELLLQQCQKSWVGSTVKTCKASNVHREELFLESIHGEHKT